MMKTINFVRPLVITGLLLILPVLGSKFVNGWAWSTSDYIFAGVMFFALSSLFELGLSLSSNVLYRGGFILALFTGFAIIWGNLAVGFIGSEDNPINVLYLAILSAAFLSSIAFRFETQKMSRIMFATALGVELVPVIALIANSTFNEQPVGGTGTFGVFVLNTGIAVLLAGSGLLFMQAGKPDPIRQ